MILKSLFILIHFCVNSHWKNIYIFMLINFIYFLLLTCNLYCFDSKKWHLVLIFFLRTDHYQLKYTLMSTFIGFPGNITVRDKKNGSGLVPINYVSTRKSNFRKSFSKRLFKTEVGWSLLKSWNRSTLAFDGKSFCCHTLGTSNNSKNKNTYQL